MNYPNQILQLLTSWAHTINPDEDNRLWDQWLDLASAREARDFQALISSDVRKEFKMRALIVLLSPDLSILPFRWGNEGNSRRNFLNLRCIEITTLPQDLLRFAGELVCQNIDYVLGQSDKRVRDILVTYNKLIRKFLAVLPEDDDLTQRLFSRYQINDPVAYRNTDDASGYRPLDEIFCDTDIPNKWKVLADKQMRDRIVAEFEGRARPREGWEVALRCYTDHIQMSNYNGREGYSRELLASQIRFITELPGIEGYAHVLFDSWHVSHLMEAISGDDLRETRHKLARLVVLRKTEGYSEFSVWNPESYRAADLMLREFGAEDQELAAKLRAMIAEANRREAENADTQRKQQQKIADVLSQMR